MFSNLVRIISKRKDIIKDSEQKENSLFLLFSFITKLFIPFYLFFCLLLSNRIVWCICIVIVCVARSWQSFQLDWCALAEWFKDHASADLHTQIIVDEIQMTVQDLAISAFALPTTF